MIASMALVGVAAAALIGLSVRDDARAPGTPPPSGPTTSTTAAPDAAPTTTILQFADGETASNAAESLIAPYLQSEYAESVTDVACSTPATGAEGEQFVCYALKPGDLVIAMRASIGAELVISLQEIANEVPVTSSEVPTTSSP